MTGSIHIINTCRKMVYWVRQRKFQISLCWPFARCIVVIQSSAVITRSIIRTHYTNVYRNRGRISIRFWIHERHPIHRPNGWAMGCLLLISVRKLIYVRKLNKLLSKQSRHMWFETPSRSLWCHCNHLPSIQATGSSVWLGRGLNSGHVPASWHSATMLQWFSLAAWSTCITSRPRQSIPIWWYR